MHGEGGVQYIRLFFSGHDDAMKLLHRIYRKKKGVVDALTQLTVSNYAL